MKTGNIHFYFRVALMLSFVFIGFSCNTTSENDKLSISYEKYEMPNGLQVILHTDHSDPMISYSIMYHVGSSREKPGKTGFAHLFEHLLFGGSENVPLGDFDLIMESVGGQNNGFTNRDITTYFEVFPKNALEKVLWLESDRMGFFINSVTPRKLAIQQNVVQNEKRQYEDNAPYGFTNYVIYKNLYPENHPYNWEVIGEMNDLKNASLNDVQTYYDHFYGPNNATLVLAGDFNPDSVKILIDKYFGEIKSHGQVEKRDPMPVSLSENKRLYHEDNFATVPEITLVWPVPENFNKDMYALDFLAQILADGKKAPLYKVLVKEKQLTSRTTAYNRSSELAGEFTIRIRANEGKNLKEIEAAIQEAFDRFEIEGITEKDVERIKASSEKGFYQQINSVFGKSLQLAFYNTFMDDPGYIEKDIENIKAVTLEDINLVYNKYIKDRPHIVTSFVPKRQAGLMADNSVEAGIEEENINEASQVEIAESTEESVTKTPSALDRTVEPPAGPEPELNVPEIWQAELKNGIKVYGIENKELPLVDMRIVIDGGVSQDQIDLPGVASLVAAVLPEGTMNKTPEDLEEEIELLGSSISVYSGLEEITMVSGMLSRNFDKTISLMKEIMLTPRWDTTEFRIAKTTTLNRLIQAKSQPRSVASRVFMEQLYGTENIFGINSSGTLESVDQITMEDLTAYYERCFSPKVTRILIAGNISKEKALEALRPFETEWTPKEVTFKNYPVPPLPEKSKIYFVDIPGSRQSVIMIGYPAIKRSNPDYIRAEFINYRLGGAFTSILNQIMREEKGYTYGAYSTFREMKYTAPFIASSSVRSDATYESVKIFKEEMEKYRNGLSDDDLQFVKNCMIRANALRFETNYDLTGMLFTMAKFNLPNDYIKNEEAVIHEISSPEAKEIIDKYIIPDSMIYVVVGDAATQIQPLREIGFGPPILIKK